MRNSGSLLHPDLLAAHNIFDKAVEAVAWIDREAARFKLAEVDSHALGAVETNSEDFVVGA